MTNDKEEFRRQGIYTTVVITVTGHRGDNYQNLSLAVPEFTI